MDYLQGFGLKKDQKFYGLQTGLMLVLFGQTHLTNLILLLHLVDIKNLVLEEKVAGMVSYLI